LEGPKKIGRHRNNRQAEKVIVKTDWKSFGKQGHHSATKEITRQPRKSLGKQEKTLGRQ
jgi:hypothetical protein